MTIIEYLYNVFSIICIVDLIICECEVHRFADVVAVFGINDFTKIKMAIEKVVSILYIAYIIYKVTTHFIH